MLIPCPDNLSCLVQKLKNYFSTEDHTHDYDSDYAAIDHSHNIDGVYVGEIRMFAGYNFPAGWVICNGAEILRSSLLGQVIETYFGDGNGTTTCNLPDFKGLFPVGVWNGRSGGPSYPLGQTGGVEEHTLSVDEIPNHRHKQTDMWNGGVVSGGSGGLAGGSAVNWGGATSYYTDYEGGGDPHENMPPYLAVNFIIYAGE